MSIPLVFLSQAAIIKVVNLLVFDLVRPWVLDAQYAEMPDTMVCHTAVIREPGLRSNTRGIEGPFTFCTGLDSELHVENAFMDSCSVLCGCFSRGHNPRITLRLLQVHSYFGNCLMVDLLKFWFKWALFDYFIHSLRVQLYQVIHMWWDILNRV